VQLFSDHKKGATKAPFFYIFSLTLLLSFSLVFLSCNTYINSPSQNLATVKKVVDGDSIELTTGEKIRYKGINAPEKNQHLYQEAYDFNKSLLAGKQVRIEYDLESKDQYGRSLGYVYVDQTLINCEMLKSGLAILYGEDEIGKNKQQFLESMNDAKRNNKGLWQPSLYHLTIERINANAPGEDTKNVNGEWVEIKNISKDSVQLQGFILKDESNNEYILPTLFLSSNSTIRIFSGKGKNTQHALYWGNDHPIWNNDSDSAYLFDNKFKLIDRKKYP
jgi:micrococcal nuclease